RSLASIYDFPSFEIATSISIYFACNCLLTKLMAYNTSYHMTIATINSYSPSSLFAKPLASLLFFTSLSISDTESLSNISTLKSDSFNTFNTTLPTCS
ncbi:hypothetical protein PVAP13_3NG176812, partial [Panicum virgatum]